VILAMVPHLAAWALGQVNGALAAAGAARTPELVANLENQGVLLHGLEILGGGAALSGIVFAAITVFVIEHKLRHAAAFAIAGALFTLFGLMHGERVGLTPHPGVAVGYLLVAAFLAVCDRYSPRGERSEPQHNQD